MSVMLTSTNEHVTQSINQPINPSINQSNFLQSDWTMRTYESVLKLILELVLRNLRFLEAIKVHFRPKWFK